MLPLSDDYYATWGSRLMQMENTGKIQTLAVLFKFREGSEAVQGWVMEWEAVTSLDSGNARCVGAERLLARPSSLSPICSASWFGGGPAAHLLALVPGRVPFSQSKGGNTLARGPPLVRLGV